MNKKNDNTLNKTMNKNKQTYKNQTYKNNKLNKKSLTYYKKAINKYKNPDFKYEVQKFNQSRIEMFFVHDNRPNDSFKKELRQFFGHLDNQWWEKTNQVLTKYLNRVIVYYYDTNNHNLYMAGSIYKPNDNKKNNIKTALNRLFKCPLVFNLSSYKVNYAGNMTFFENGSRRMIYDQLRFFMCRVMFKNSIKSNSRLKFVEECKLDECCKSDECKSNFV